MRAYERLLQYARVYTTSDPESGTHPSAAREFDLAHMLVEEMKNLGIEDARVDEHCYVYGTLPATPGCEKLPALGLIAHMDTAPDASGENVNPILHENYDGNDVTLPATGMVMKTSTFPFLKKLKGETLITTDGTKDKVLYTKLNAEDLTILAEGELEIPAPTDWTKLTSSGILTYRQSDKKLYYFYYWKEKAGQTVASEQEPRFHVAVINPSTMKVEEDSTSPVDGEMAGSAYGELMQDCVMYDEAGNLYLACFHEEESGIERGMLLRIKAGATTFDASYNGYSNADGKLMTVQYLSNNKALIYARNDNAPISDKAAASGIKKPTAIDAFSHYYAILDLSTGAKTRLSYNGKEVAYSGGRFSQRSVIFNNKAYIGVDTEEDANAVIYIYDLKTGTVEKGAEIDGSFYYDMIRVVEND